MDHELIDLTSEFLAGLAEVPGLHKRLIAGLQSVLDRYGDPVVTGYERAGEGRPPYRDYDLIVHLRPGETSCRRVEGRMSWPLHVSNTGATRSGGLRTAPSIDLIVWSGEGTEATRFRGAIERPALAHPVEVLAEWAEGQAVVRIQRISRETWWTRLDEAGEVLARGTITEFEPTSTSVYEEVLRLLRRIAERAAFGEIARDEAGEVLARAVPLTGTSE